MGQNHGIKMAIFKACSEYDDNYYNYHQLLILIDENFHEVDHNINIESVCPEYGEDSNDIVSDVTFYIIDRVKKLEELVGDQKL